MTELQAALETGKAVGFLVGVIMGPSALIVCGIIWAWDRFVAPRLSEHLDK